MAMVKRVFLGGCLLLLGFSFAYAQKFETLPFLQHTVSVLASDSLQGRAAGSPHGEKAARFIYHHLQQQNADFLFPGGFQEFHIKGNLSPTNKNKLYFRNEPFSLYQDYLPFQRSINTAVEAQISFVGFGVSTARHDDYKNIDVEGKWVLLFRGTPSYITTNIKLKNKIIHAAQKGAAGILVTTPDTPEFQDDWLALQTNQSLPFSLFFSDYSDLNVPILQISTELADCIVAEHHSNVSDLSKLLHEYDTVINFLTTDNLYAESDIRKEELTLRNIAVVLTGTDPKLEKEYIVVGAHYDHLGINSDYQGQYPNGTIFHGADDNASGVATVMEVFKRLQTEPRNKRSVLFLFFDGEENGLLGSEYFVNHLPETIPLSAIKAMVNLDMVGRYDNELQILMSQSSDKGKEYIEKLATRTSLHISTPERSYFATYSDHYPFYKKGIPVVFFFTGTHPDYHKPSDTANKINYNAMKSIAELVEDLVLDLCNDKSNLRFKKLPDL